MDWIMLAGLGLTAIGSFILGFTLFRAKNVINGMTVTLAGSNPIFRQELHKERGRGIWGISFLLSGFLIQAIGYILHIIGCIS